MDAAGDLGQLLQRAGCLGDGLIELPAEFGRHLGLRRAQLQRQRDQPLLGAIVQVPLDPPAGLVGGGYDPGPRGNYLGLCLCYLGLCPGVRDRGRHQLSEPG